MVDHDIEGRKAGKPVENYRSFFGLTSLANGKPFLVVFCHGADDFLRAEFSKRIRGG